MVLLSLKISIFHVEFFCLPTLHPLENGKNSEGKKSFIFFFKSKYWKKREIMVWFSFWSTFIYGIHCDCALYSASFFAGLFSLVHSISCYYTKLVKKVICILQLLDTTTRRGTLIRTNSILSLFSFLFALCPKKHVNIFYN